MDQQQEYGVDLDKISWYPGHMKKAMKELEDKISDVQLFLEVRDSRVPFSSKNFHFDELIQKYQKEKIIIFNKYDLCDQSITSKIVEKYKAVGIKCLNVSAKKQLNLKSILDLVGQSKQAKFATVGIWLMICGMPNVGKSAIINQIRQIAPQLVKRKALAKQTPIPCTTKSLTGMKISESPLTFLVDSPGVMIPNITKIETGMKLGLVGCINDRIVIKERMMDYLVWKFNNKAETRYFKPANGGEYMLQIRDKYKHFNYETTFDFILSDFREGRLGKVTLDDIDILN